MGTPDYELGYEEGYQAALDWMREREAKKSAKPDPVSIGGLTRFSVLWYIVWAAILTVAIPAAIIVVVLLMTLLAAIANGIAELL
jgi:hypothetical protein